ncbi:MAG: hypothetical protein HY695_22220 [Deltaproteobacteria bacterium]|nr:hypothetical protein [Deltaproteobacteria bacterium]
MVIQAQKIIPHWNYLLAIERDLIELSRYVEFDERNFNCFSMELAKVLLASAAEVDVVCKQICKAIDTNSSADDINKYRNEIKAAFAGIPQFVVLLPRFGLKLKPWDEWNGAEGVPPWWTGYNKVKHHRDSEYHRVNLKNALNAVAGLFVMVLYLYKDKAQLGELIPPPQVLMVDDDHFGGENLEFYDAGIAYRL